MPARSTVAVGRKLCSSVHHEGQRWLPIMYFDVNKRLSSGEILYFAAACKTCARLAQRARLGQQRRVRTDGLTPEERRIRANAQARVAYQRAKQDKTRLEDMRLRWRLDKERLRRAQGIKPRPIGDRRRRALPAPEGP